MRSSRRSKILKKPYRHRIHKKKYRNTTKGIWKWSDDVSGLYLDDINEVLRKNKARRADGHFYWKVMPKDSCEVYKNRRKRNSEANRQKQQTTEDSSDESDSRIGDVKKAKKKPKKKHQKKKKSPNKKVGYKTKSNASTLDAETHSSFSCTTMTMTTSEDSDLTEMEYD